jgi:Trk K+ transport system NAD-binding subunit
MKSRVGHRIVDRLRKPLPNRILREAPLLEDIFSGGKDWAVSPVTIKQRLRSVGLSVAEISAEGNIEILSIDRAGAYLARPGGEEKIEKGDRLLVYVNRNSLPRLVG